MITTMKRKELLVAISAFVVATPVFAQVTTPVQDAWHFEATPYLWAAGIDGWGRIGARTPTVKINESFSDVWRNLDVGAMGAFVVVN
jgi:hypothetical protein